MKGNGQLEIVEMALFRPGHEGFPLRGCEDENRPAAVVLGVADTDAIGRQTAYLDAIAIELAEAALPERGPADIG